MRWKWIERGIAMLVGALGTWPATIGIGGKEGEWQKKEDWNIKRKESKESMNIQTIYQGWRI